MKAAIIAIGDELISGATQDVNASFIARALAAYGVGVESVTFVGDEMSAIITALTRGAATSRLVITTGGIGPTSDDITRYAVAEFTGQELELRQSCLDKLTAYLKAKGRELTETNKRQAFIPRDADIITNELGTADAFLTPFADAAHSGKILTLPGVPREMRALLDTALPQVCAELFTISSQRSEVVLQIFGLPESEIGERIERLNLSDKIIVAYRPHFPVVSVELITRDVDLLREAKEKVVAALGGESHVFAYGRGHSMSATVGGLLRDCNMSFAVAESCTGGLIAHRVVSEPGSSAYFNGGVVTYSNDAKKKLLNVGDELLQQHGAVSLEVAAAMARGARLNFAADVAVSVTGIAGPDGGSLEKPVGTICFGYADATACFALRYQLAGTRDYLRQLSAIVALDLLRRQLLKIENFYPNLAQKLYFPAS